MVHNRPDIAYAVGVVSRYMERPTVMHWNVVKRILRYLKGTLSYGLIYSKEAIIICCPGIQTVTWQEKWMIGGVLCEWYFILMRV